MTARSKQRLDQAPDHWRLIGAIVVATLANVIARLHHVSQAHARVLAEHLLAVEHQDRT